VNRRILAAVLALGMALVGTVALVAYVRGADSRALAGVQTTSVLVVTEPIAEGTPAEEIADSVRLSQIPVKVAATGNVRDLDDLADQVSLVDLQPGEQVLASRFADPDSLRVPGTVAVPPGAQEISVLLEPQRAVGGRLAPGDEIGVYISMKLEGNGEDEPSRLGTTHAVLHGVLVTQVQGAPARPEKDDETQTASSGSTPTDALMLTLALPARDAERVIFGMEHGTVWLGLEPEGADNSGTQIITQGNIYGRAVA
jgi:pilus assembly protein CpaB